jgi:hypothetical protein
VHSFNLHNKKIEVVLLSNPDMANAQPVACPRSSTKYALIIEGLFKDFVRLVREYRQDLTTDPVLRANFEKMFGSYGTIKTFSVVLEPVK